MLAVLFTVLHLAAPCASAADVDHLRDLLSRNRFNPAEVDAAIAQVAGSGDAAGLPVLSEALNRFGERFAEVDGMRALRERQLEALLEDKNADKGEIKTVKQQAEIVKGNAALYKHMVAGIEKGLLTLLDAVGKGGSVAAVPRLMDVYEVHATQALEVELALSEIKGELAETQSKLDHFKGMDDTPFRIKRAQLMASWERMEDNLGTQVGVREKTTEAVAVVLSLVPEKDRKTIAKDVLFKVGKASEIPTRIVFMDLYAGFGLEKGADDLVKMTKKSAKELRTLRTELEKLRKRYYSTMDAYFNMLKASNDMIRVDLRDSFQQLSEEMQGLSTDVGLNERLLKSAGLAVGLSVHSMPEKPRKAKIKWLLGAASKGKDSEARAWIVESLARCDVPEVREYLRKAILTEKNIKCRIAAIEAVVQLQDEECLDDLRGAVLQHENWRVRTAAIRALRRIQRNENIQALIDALEADVGRLKEEASEALVYLTGQNFHKNVALWQRWWKNNQETFDISTVERKRDLVVAKEGELDARQSVTFYGVGSDSKRICFCLDVSKSMEEPVSGRGDKRKLDIAKEELKKAVTALKDGDMFSVVLFAGDIQRWQPRMTKMSKTVKSKVLRWIDNDVSFELGTNIHLGIMTALAMAGIGANDSKYESAIDTIFFLSDGDPTVGEVIDTAEIRRLVRDKNRLSRIRIHAIGVGDGANQTFLYGLAEDSGGLFMLRR